MDETTKQCVRETREPQPTAPGRAARYDAEYERNGVAHLLLYYAPLENWTRPASEPSFPRGQGFART